MNAVVVRGFRGNHLPAAPLRDGQFRFTFEMVFDQGKYRAYADTFVELLDVLMPGYAQMADADTRLVARIQYMKNVQPVLQAMLMTAAPPQDLDELSAADRALLSTPVSQPVETDEWANRLPLVLTTCDYIPYTDVPAPVSAIADVENPPNLWWLRIEDDESMLMSLAAHGWIGLSQNVESAP